MPRILTFSELKALGVPYCQDHLRRLCDAGQFPAPVPISTRRIGWVEEEVIAWIASLIAKRDAAQAAKPVEHAEHGADGAAGGHDAGDHKKFVTSGRKKSEN